jgi:hypothetical protein
MKLTLGVSAAKRRRGRRMRWTRVGHARSRRQPTRGSASRAGRPLRWSVTNCSTAAARRGVDPRAGPARPPPKPRSSPGRPRRRGGRRRQGCGGMGPGGHRGGGAPGRVAAGRLAMSAVCSQRETGGVSPRVPPPRLQRVAWVARRPGPAGRRAGPRTPSGRRCRRSQWTARGGGGSLALPGGGHRHRHALEVAGGRFAARHPARQARLSESLSVALSGQGPRGRPSRASRSALAAGGRRGRARSVRVEATGLNFLNVLSALGGYPGAAGGFRSLGIECAGEVVRVGPEVASLAPGDLVLGLADHCLARHALARQELLVRRPQGMPAAHGHDHGLADGEWLGTDGSAARCDGILPVAGTRSSPVVVAGGGLRVTPVAAGVLRGAGRAGSRGQLRARAAPHLTTGPQAC